MASLFDNTDGGAEPPLSVSTAMKGGHFVTGATGFVGSSVVLELVRRTDDPIVCLVRSTGDDAAADGRLRMALKRAALACDAPELVSQVEERCSAVEGDLLAPRCGVDLRALPSLGMVWHCGASLRYEDEHKDAIWSTNVDGTANVLSLAQSARQLPFRYVSTAFVAGDRTGHIEEAAAPSDVRLNNWYERSKLAAERLVATSTLPDWRIVRPTIVIGHSRTKSTTSSSGLYGFVRGFRRFNSRVAQQLGDFLRHRPMRFFADPDCPINMIPVDAVARGLVTIGLAGDCGPRYYHLANVDPPRLGESLDMLCQELDLASPTYVSTDSAFTTIDRELDAELRFYRSYLSNAKQFDAAAAMAVVGKADLSWALNPDELRAYVRAYLATLDGRPQQPDQVVRTR